MMLLAVVLAWAPSPAAPQADAVDAARAAAQRHARAVVAERVVTFLDAWVAADGPARERARTELSRRAEPGAGALTQPSLRALGGAVRAMTAADAEPAPELEELVLGVDLIVRPGAFEARAEGDGEPITVRVRAIAPVAERGGVDLKLVWRGPGGAEVVARREPVAGSAWSTTGFDMFVRPPASEPGVWHLVPEVVRGERSARGAPVPVECVRELRERSRRLLERAGRTEVEDAPIPLVLAVQAIALAGDGVRLSATAGVGRWLEIGELGGRAPGPVPAAVAFVDADGAPHPMWVAERGGDTLVLLLAQAVQSADAPLAGAVGRRWSEACRAEGWSLASTHLPDEFALADDAVDARAVLALARGELEARRVVVVAAGPTLVRLATALVGAEAPFDGVALAAVVNGAEPPDLFPGVPTLVAAPGGEAPGSEVFDRELAWVEGARPVLLAEPRLPGLTRAWWRHRSPGSGGDR